MSNRSIVRYTIAPCWLGQLLLAIDEAGICALFFAEEANALEQQLRGRFSEAKLQRDAAALETWLRPVLQQLHNPNDIAQLALSLRGSLFQQQVWQALRTIPCGKTFSYGQLALQLGSHARAVARACASNPVALLVPCHRVIAANGSLNGYRWGIERKAALLKQEAAST